MNSSQQPVPLLYSGEAGTYYGTEYEGLPTGVDNSIRDVGQALTHQGLSYLGKLTCSQCSQVDVYVYATNDQRVSVSVMATESGLNGVDCVSKFADAAFLTTTTVQVIADAYEQQNLFRVSLPGSNVEELLKQHLSYVASFEADHGAVQAIAVDLEAIARMVDEYTTRQQTDPIHHGFTELGSAFARARMAQIQEELAEDLDNDLDEDDEYEERIEYSEESASPLIRAILNDNLDEVRELLSAGAEVDAATWEDPVPVAVAVHIRY